MSDAAENTVAKRGEATRFKPGNPGRPKGSRNKFAEEFLTDFLADWQECGKDAIAACRASKPDAYLKVAVQIIPKQVDVTVSEIEKLDDAELLKRIADLESRADALVNGAGPAQAGEVAAHQHPQASALPAIH